MNPEMKQAVQDLKVKWEMFNQVNEDFQGVLYYEIKAAEARIDSIRREVIQNKREN